MDNFNSCTLRGQNASLEKLCAEGQLGEALGTLDRLEEQGFLVSTKIFHSLVKRCISNEDLEAGKKLARLILRSGIGYDNFLGSQLIRMFASCGSLLEANQVFSKILKPNVFMWGSIISAHVKLRQEEQAIRLYHQMKRLGVEPDGHVFVAALKASVIAISPRQGKLIHADIVGTSFESAVFVGNTLIDMYTKFGSIVDARRVFDKSLERDVVSWNSMISGYTQHGYFEDAFQLLQQMQQERLEPNILTWNVVIGGLMQHGFTCEALELFQQMQEGIEPNVMTWNAMIAGLAQNDQCEKALQLVEQMQEHRIEPDQVTFLSILNAISNMRILEEENQSQAQLMGNKPSTSDQSSLIDMARKVFDKLSRQTTEAWNAMIAGYAQRGNGLEALQLFEQMQEQCLKPDKITFVSVLKVFSSISTLDQGRLMHARIVESGLELDGLVGSALIDMYAKSGSFTNAFMVLDKLPTQDVVTWSALIVRYTQHGCPADALRIFYQMQLEGVEPNKVTFVFVLKASSSLTAFDQAKLIHACILKNGCDLDVYLGSSLVDTYAKCGSLEDAQLVFNRLPMRIPMAWNAMIVSCVQYGKAQEALGIFWQMQHEGLEPNKDTYVSILKCCSSTVALDEGYLFHVALTRNGFELDAHIASALINLYAKCGRIEDASRVIKKLPRRDLVTWNILISGYAQIGDHQLVLQCLEELQVEGFKPDNVTFVCLLSVCNHMGLVNQGCHLFKKMMQDHGIVPTLQHLNCMVDLLGRAGYLCEAEDLLHTMPLTPSVVGWTSLLSHCKTHTDVELGRKCFDWIASVDSSDASFYVLFCTVYAHVGMGKSAEQVEDFRKSAQVWKVPASAFVEVGNKVHFFGVGDKSHSQKDCVYTKLSSLSVQTQEDGYMPYENFVSRAYVRNQ